MIPNDMLSQSVQLRHSYPLCLCSTNSVARPPFCRRHLQISNENKTSRKVIKHDVLINITLHAHNIDSWEHLSYANVAQLSLDMQISKRFQLYNPTCVCVIAVCSILLAVFFFLLICFMIFLCSNVSTVGGLVS